MVTVTWSAVKCMFHYLKGTINHGIILGGRNPNEVLLSGYTDADWGDCPDTQRSISGFIFQINNGPVTWSAKKQPTVALSSMEAKYMAMSIATWEIMWLHTLLSKLGFQQETATPLQTDNRSAIDLANNLAFHG